MCPSREHRCFFRLVTIEDYHLDLPDIDHSIHLDNMGHHLQTTVNYYADPGDGSPPTPVYVGRHAPPPPFPGHPHHSR